ncbi:hypothetical protein PENSPDRAFT_748940 [Peniophora sp. CONT]|nr:hypothetical protein PENSPDRAFT_748940 [Peniophora sp. CONT]
MKAQTETTIRKARKTSTSTATKKKAVGPPKEDILAAIQPCCVAKFVARVADHEFKKYLINNDVKRVWFYSSKPVQALRYIAVISKGKAPGEIDDEHGEGNHEFNKQKSGFAYEINELYEMKRPIPLEELKSKYKTTYPQRFVYVPPKLLEDIKMEEQTRLF